MKVALKALQKQVAELTAATFETWLAERVTQVAVAWVLGSVFLCFCEVNGLVEVPSGGRSARLAEDDLRSWAPPQAGRGRRRSS